MKVRCATHPNRDALGVCLGCGAGVCAACRVTVAGLTYCNTCLEAGRYRPPQVVSPSPESPSAIAPTVVGSANRIALLAGILGFLLFGIGMQSAWVASFLGFYSWMLPPSGPFGPAGLLETIASFVIGIALTLCGCAFAAFARFLRSPLSGYAAAASFCSAWWLFAANLLQYTGLVWTPLHPEFYPRSPGPLYPQYATLQIIGLTLLGTTMLLWSSALVVTRRLHNQKRLAVAAAILFIVAAHIILLPIPISIVPFMPSFVYFPYPFYLLFLIAAGLIEPACILCAVLVYRFQARK